ncbi:MAG: aminopeptidase, partial [Desulfurococcales archaeon ex4484_58]
MKAYVSIDIEGLPGIASITMVTPTRSQYSRGSKIMTSIAKEIANLLFENGFERVVIADSHGYMTNIDYLEMPRGTSIIQGYPRPYSMVYGLDKDFDAALFIGYHTAAGTIHGFLDHTMSGRVFHEIIVNGIRASEYLLNALYAGEKNVPVILVAGDEYLRSDVQKHTPWTVFIDLKKGITRYAARFDSYEEVIDKLRKGVQIAINRLKRGEAKPYT